MLITMPDSKELEVVPGHSIYADEVPGAPQGVFLTWEHLSAGQQAKFQAVHTELAQVVTKLKDMFSAEFAGRGDTPVEADTVDAL